MLTVTCEPVCTKATTLPEGPPPVPGGTSGGGGGGAQAVSCCGHEWQFSTATTEPPTGRSIRLDNADKTLATKMWITKLNSPGDDMASELAAGALVGRRLYIKELDVSDVNAIYTITGPIVDKGTYIEVPISFALTLPVQRVSLTIIP